MNPLQPRRRLTGLALTGARRAVRSASLTLLTVLTGLSALLHLVERHREALGGGWDAGEPYTWGPAHSLAGESAGLPVILPLVVLAACLWARRGFPRALLPAVLAVGAFLALVAMWIAAHLFDTTDDPPLTVLAILSTVGGALTGIWMAIVEIAAPILERRRLEATDPVFPTARAL
jgi:hypothetical protein